MTIKPSRSGRHTSKWLEPKGYLHFDRRPSKAFVRAYCSDPMLIAKHQFWPLIEFKKLTKRYRQGKTRSKERTIRYSSHLDSAVFGYYAEVLTERYEKLLAASTFGRSVLAYRQLGKMNAHFAVESFEHIRDMAPCHVIALDLKDFFDSLEHRRIKEAWKRVLELQKLPDDHYAVFRATTKWCVVDQENVRNTFDVSRGDRRRHHDRICSPKDFRTKLRGEGKLRQNPGAVGIPQGLALSAVLSNVYMLDVDAALFRLISDIGGRYWRYSDDILLVVPEHADPDQLLEQANSILKSAGLEIHQDKTDRVTFSRSSSGVHATKPLQYLGFTYDGQRVLIRSQTLARYYRSMKRAVRQRVRTALASGHGTALRRRSLYERFSHLGRVNFVRYALRSSAISDSRLVRRQVARCWPGLDREIREQTKREAVRRTLRRRKSS